MENKTSAVIPTLQKNKELLLNLIGMLEQDETVAEIIVIDNSGKGLGDFTTSKLRVIVPKENLYVNPSWNLGVREAKSEIVALLNDDITVPSNFCKNITKQMPSDMGAAGFNCNYIELNEGICPPPEETPITLEKLDCRNMHWGIAIFFYKKFYPEIPDDIKIFYGDDWIFDMNKRAGRQNYLITGQRIYHVWSLSVGTLPKKNPIFTADKKNFKKHTLKWYQYIFDLQKIYNGFRLRIFNIELTHHFIKNHFKEES